MSSVAHCQDNSIRATLDRLVDDSCGGRSGLKEFGDNALPATVTRVACQILRSLKDSLTSFDLSWKVGVERELLWYFDHVHQGKLGAT